MCDELDAQGADVPRILQLAGLTREQLRSRQNMLTALEVDSFFTAAAQVTSRTDLGFLQGSLVKLNSHEFLGYGLLSSETLDDGLKLSERHYHLMTELFRMKYRSGPWGGEATYTPLAHFSEPTLAFCLESIAVTTISGILLMFLARGQTPVFDVHLSIPEPPHLSLYGAYQPVRFHWRENRVPSVRVVFPPGMLSEKSPMADGRVVAEVDAYCSQLKGRPVSVDGEWVDYVAMMIRQSRVKLTMEMISEQIGVSPKTVDRRLKSGGTSFRELTQKIQMQVAIEKLRERQMTVGEVATSLGFSTVTNFSRAFKRQFGVSPSEYVASDSRSGF